MGLYKKALDTISGGKDFNSVYAQKLQELENKRNFIARLVDKFKPSSGAGRRYAAWRAARKAFPDDVLQVENVGDLASGKVAEGLSVPGERRLTRQELQLLGQIISKLPPDSFTREKGIARDLYLRGVRSTRWTNPDTPPEEYELDVGDRKDPSYLYGDEHSPVWSRGSDKVYSDAGVHGVYGSDLYT